MFQCTKKGCFCLFNINYDLMMAGTIGRVFNLDISPPRPKGQPQISVEFRCDENGRITALARDLCDRHGTLLIIDLCQHDQDWAYERKDKEGKKFGDELERIGYLGSEPCLPRPLRARADGRSRLRRARPFSCLGSAACRRGGCWRARR